LIGFRSPGAGVVRVTTGIAGDVTANDATDCGVGGGRRPGGMTGGAAGDATLPDERGADGGGVAGRMGGVAGRLVSGAEAGAKA